MNKGQKIALVAGFLILAVLYFFVGDWGCDWLICRRWVAVPTLVATLATALNFKRGGWLIPLALLASSAGDWAGAMGEFIFQIAFFAVAHICYISDFAPRRVASRGRFAGATALAVVTLCYLGLVLSHIASQAEFVAVAIYGLIIYIMGATAIFQQRRFYAWYVVAAMLLPCWGGMVTIRRRISPRAKHSSRR